MRLHEIQAKTGAEQRAGRLKANAAAAQERARQLRSQADASAEQAKNHKSAQAAARGARAVATTTITPYS